MRNVFQVVAGLFVCGALVPAASAQGPSAPRDTPNAPIDTGFQRAELRSLWIDFANNYYKVNLNGGPKAGAKTKDAQSICFEFKARPDPTVALRMTEGLTKLSGGERPVYLGLDTPTEWKISKEVSNALGGDYMWTMKGAENPEKLSAFFDFTSDILNRPPKVVLHLAAMRRVVIKSKKTKKIVGVVPVQVSLRGRIGSFTQEDAIYVPGKRCSGMIDKSIIREGTTAELEVVDLAKVLREAKKKS